MELTLTIWLTADLVGDLVESEIEIEIDCRDGKAFQNFLLHKYQTNYLRIL